MFPGSRAPGEPEVSLWLLPVQIRTFVRLRAGAGRRSGSGRRPGRVRWGRPLLSRPRGAFGSWAAAVEPLSRPRIRSSSRPATRSGRAGVLVGLDGCEVRLCDPCACVRPCVPCVSRLPPRPRCPGVFLPVPVQIRRLDRVGERFEGALSSRPLELQHAHEG